MKLNANAANRDHASTQSSRIPPRTVRTLTLPGNRQQVTVCALSVHHIEQLITRENHIMALLKDILTNCIQTPKGLDLNTLLACDCNALLLAARQATFGNECDFLAACPVCEKRHIYTIDLSQLQQRAGDREIVQRQLDDPQATHPFTFPERKLTSRFRLRTGKQLFTDTHPTPLNSSQTGPVSQTLSQYICSIEAVQQEGIPLKVFLRDGLSGGDADDFFEMYKEVEPGYDDTVELTCPTCYTPFEEKFVLQVRYFFRRSRRKKPYGKPSSA